MAKKIAKTRFNDIVAQRINHVATHLSSIAALVDEYPEHMTAEDCDSIQKHIAQCSETMVANVANSLRRNDVQEVGVFAFAKAKPTPRTRKAKADEKPKEVTPVIETAAKEAPNDEMPIEEAAAEEAAAEKPPVVDELDDLGNLDDLGDLDELLKGAA